MLVDFCCLGMGRCCTACCFNQREFLGPTGILIHPGKDVYSHILELEWLFPYLTQILRSLDQILCITEVIT